MTASQVSTLPKQARRARFLSRQPVSTLEQGGEPAEAPESGIHAIDDVHASGSLAQVTLVVYGWKNVEPGTLSWVFPTLTMALAAVRTMTNASRWSIVAGSRSAEVDIDAERSHGAVLVEQAS
jgi:hypothetical protein